MGTVIRQQSKAHLFYYALFGVATLTLLWYYLSNTLVHFTTPQQFPISSFERFPLTMLIFPAELFSFLFGLYFIYTLFSDQWRPPVPKPFKDKRGTRVAILLPVYNEPMEIVDQTIRACLNLRWPGGIRIYLLDDSTNAEDIRNMAALARKHGCVLVRRDDRVGYKAGNINNGIKHHVREDFFVILDSDQAPLPEFLEHTMDHLSDPTVGFVQTPQHFTNDDYPIGRAAKIGTDIFYHGMCVAKAKDGAMAFCGTNAVTRMAAFKAVGGFSYYTATEDIDLGIRMNDAGYHGAYVPEILVHGYAPPDFTAYSSQQYRWANGNLAIMRENLGKMLRGRFSLKYLIHTFFTLGWWLIGIITLLYITVPILSFFLGGTHHTWLPDALLAWVYVHVLLGIGIIYVALHKRTSERITFRDAFLEYSIITNSMFIYAKAAWNALVLKRYVGFVRTNKKRSASSLWHIKWNLGLAAICFGLSIYALFQATRAVDLQGFRTFFPISLWLLFYATILASSIIFIGDPEGDA